MTALSIRGGALALGAAALLAAISPAEAQHHPRRHAGQAVAGGVIGGLLGGLAAGAIIGAGRPGYYHPPVAEPAPVYLAPPEPVYVPTCHIVRRKVWLDDYAYTFRRERVCE
jgi:MFS family permease